MDTSEQQARDMLERMGWDAAQSLTAGDVAELANLIAERDAMAKGIEEAAQTAKSALAEHALNFSWPAAAPSK